MLVELVLILPMSTGINCIIRTKRVMTSGSPAGYIHSTSVLYRHRSVGSTPVLYTRWERHSTAVLACRASGSRYALGPYNTVDPSTACCERGFSAMKRVKNDWRSSLSSTSLNSILRIVIDGPSVNDFCPNSALETWWESSQRSRRPDFHRL